MRVLLTADTVGGVWTYALELARAMEPHGVYAALATMGALPTPEQQADAERIPGLQLFSSEYRLEWMNDPWEDVALAGEWLLGLEARLRPDLVHLNGYAHAALPWRAPVLLAGHSCVFSWWRAVKGEPPPPAYDLYRQAVAAGLRAADLVIAPTTAMLNELGRWYGPPGVARVVPNGRDPACFPPGVKEPFVFAAGRLWDEAKNVGALADAAAGLPWPVYVAGEERHPDGRQTRHPAVRSLGHLAGEDLAGWIGRASIYALPARYEPFGLSALEAAFARCALVLGDIPSLREVWGDAALFVPPDDPDALREALRALIAEPDRRRSLADRARRRAFEFTPERMAAGYLTAYRYLADGELAALKAANVGEEEEPVCVS
jgi:glycogen synthase